MNCFFDSCNQADAYAAKNKSFGVYYSDVSEPNTEIHIHECCEILFCQSGGKSFLIDDNVYEVNDGDIFIINQFQAHKVIPSRDVPFSRFIMHIHPTFLYTNSEADADLSDCFFRESAPSKIHLTKEEQKNIADLFSQFDKDYGYGDGMQKKITALKLLLEIARLAEIHTEGPAPIKKNQAVQLAIDYINKNYSHELTLERIAKASYVSVNQLCRIFNRYCGTTVSKYIISKRITEAKKMLEDGKTVTDTAFMCGFNDYANFIRVFKKAVGVPPGKYKNTISQI